VEALVRSTRHEVDAAAGQPQLLRAERTDRVDRHPNFAGRRQGGDLVDGVEQAGRGLVMDYRDGVDRRVGGQGGIHGRRVYRLGVGRLHRHDLDAQPFGDCGEAVAVDAVAADEQPATRSN